MYRGRKNIQKFPEINDKYDNLLLYYLVLLPFFIPDAVSATANTAAANNA